MTAPFRHTAAATALAWAVLAGSPPPARAAEDDLLGTVLHGLAAAPERKASFTEERRMGAVDGIITDSGTLSFRRPAHMERVTNGPEPERLVVDGDYLTITTGEEAPRVVDLAGQPDLLALIDAVRAPLEGDRAKLEAEFTVTATGTPDDWRLDLLPRAASARRYIHHVRLLGAGDAIREVRIDSENGDEQRLTLQAAP